MSDPTSERTDEGTVDRIVRKTPTWAISTGVHVLLALVFAYLVVLAQPDVMDSTVSLSKPRKIEPPPEWRDPVVDPTPFELPKPSEVPSDLRIDDQKAESIDDDDTREMRGQSLEMMTTKPFNSKARNDAIGAGPAAAGRKGGPFGGRQLHGPSGSGPSGPRKAENDAVLEALKWLARHQNPDGSWGVQGHQARCGKVKSGSCTPNPSSAPADFDAGVTSLSLLAFLGAGYSHLSRDVHDGISFGDVVRRGLQWVMAQQDPSGLVTGAGAREPMYNHALAALALSEAYGLTGSGLFKDNAQRAVDLLVSAQNPGKGWRYQPNSGDNDTSVTGWAAMALKSAELSGLRVPHSSYDGIRAWLDEVTEETYYRAGYTARGTGKVYCAHNERFNHHESMTAIALMTRLFVERQHDDPRNRGGAGLLMSDLPRWEQPEDVDFYYWYYASLALFQFESGKGARWDAWNRALTDSLLKHQNRAKDECRTGSWEPVDRWSCEGGRVYATAINALTLEVYYRYACVFTGKR